MKKRFGKRIVAMTAAGLMTISMCSGTALASDAQSEVVLTIPTFFCGENVGKVYFQGAVERFNEKYEGVYRIETEDVVEADYTEKIQQLAQTGNIPPIVHDLQREFREKILFPNQMYVPVNDILEENLELAKWCLPSAISANTLENGDIPAIPQMRISYVGLFVNESIYHPEKDIGDMSLDEFLDSLGDNDTFAFQTVNNAWTSGLFLTAIVANQEGGKELLQEYDGTKLYDYDQQCIKDAVAIFHDVWQAHAAGNSLGADYPDAVNAMTSGNAAFISNGSWMNSQLQEDASDNWSNGFDGASVKCYAFPGNILIGSTTNFERWYLTTGGTEEQRAAAKAFLEMVFTQEELEKWLLSEGGDIPRMEHTEEYMAEIEKNSLLSEQSAAMRREGVTMVPNLLDIMPDSIANSTFGNLLTQLVNDSITPEEFCAQMTQKAQETLE